ncbi:MAG: SGNH/GDSL hydrolase family protein [Bacteroidia bacterium]|nr:SGNH/GDSL hydrolase family protein [Bacteroidia bacterium]
MEKQYNSRRSFLKKAALGTLAAISIPEIISASVPKKSKKKIELLKDQTILFQGDSITDAGRSRDETGFNNPKALGTGYAMLTAVQLLEEYAELNLKVYNKGISGNKVYQLAERWDKDCIDLKPDVLSILIGVNDFWHKLNGSYNGTIEIYRNDFIALLERTKKALPNVKLVICEPYAIAGVKAVNEKWFPDFYEYQKAAREIADKFGVIFVPFQSVYDEAIKRAAASYWTADGVHAALPGAQLMAEAWLETIKNFD